jgi:hypothetical protein
MAIKDLPPPIKTPDSGAGSWSQLLDWLVLVWKFVRTPALVLSPSGDAPTTPTGAAGDSSTQIANDAFVQQEITSKALAATSLSAMYGMSGVEGVLSIIPSVIPIGTTFPALSGSRNLKGKVNATTPLTKYDLTSADYIVLTDSGNMPVVRSNVGLITNDLGLAGSTANGRDQAAVFPASSWVYIYYIWNGITLATVSSLASPSTGPVLPTGYTNWCLATAVRWNASSNIIPVFTYGNTLFYDIAFGGLARVLSGGASTTMVAVSLAGLVPPIAASTQLGVFQNAAGGLGLYVRPTGASSTGQAVANTATAINVFSMYLGTSTQIDYRVDAGGSAFIEVLGYTIPNGAC